MTLIENRASSISAWFMRMCAAMPLVLLLGFVSMAVHVRLGMGRWPKPVIENYVTVAYDLHEWAVWVVFMGAQVALAVLGLAVVLRPERKPVMRLVCYGLGCGAIILAGVLDPTPFTEWLLD